MAISYIHQFFYVGIRCDRCGCPFDDAEAGDMEQLEELFWSYTHILCSDCEADDMGKGKDLMYCRGDKP